MKRNTVKTLAAGVVLWGAACAWGANATLKKADCDLADPNNWNSWAGNGGLYLTLSGHFTMSADMEVHGFIADDGKPNLRFYFDLDDDRVLTALGDTRHAFGSNSGVNSQFWVTGGTFLVPETCWYQKTGATRANNYAIIAPQRQSTAKGGVTFGVFNREGDTKRTKNAKVMTPMLRVGYGYDNWFVASNNAEVVVGEVDLGYYAAAAANNGILIDSGAQMTVTNQAVLTTGAGSGVVSNSFIVSDGGGISGFDRFQMKGVGDLLAFRGAGTDVSFPSTTKSEILGRGDRIEVTGGASLTLSHNAQGRVWLGGLASSVSNVIRVAGAGSRFVANGTGFLLGQNTGSDNGVEVTDGARADFNSLHVGHAGTAANPVRGCYLKVSDGGVVVDAGETDVGGASNAGSGNEYSEGNWLEVTSGGVVSNDTLQIGCFTSSRDNAVVVDGGRIRTTRNVFCNYKGVGSRVTIRNGGVLDVGGQFFTGLNDQNATWCGTDARVEVLSGGVLSAAGNVHFHGTNSTLVVSNGTVSAEGMIHLPYYYPADRSCHVVIAGANPVVRAANGKGDRFGIGFRYDAQVHFVVPDGGYAEAPFQSLKGEVNMANNWQVPMTFDLSACGRGLCFETVLIESKDKQLTFGENQAVDRANYLKKVNDAMPRDAVGGHPLAKVYTTPDGCRLVLRVGQRGAAVIVK